jgi:beta-hydroxyacyl-ACP dehydratase FabZ
LQRRPAQPIADQEKIGMKAVYDIQEIMNALPHRYPFLLVDRIIEIVPGERLTGLKNVTINEPFFQGHFPAAPVMPGVMIVEAMAQAGGMLAFASLPEDKKGSVIYFMGMDKVRFRKPVVPGDQLIFNISFIKKRKSIFKMSGVATVDEQVVADGELMANIGENL